MLINKVCIALRTRLWMKSLLKSILATVFYSVAVGAFFVPQEVARLRNEPRMLSTDCVAVPDGSAIISISLAFVDSPTKSVAIRRSIMQSLVNDQTPPQFILPEVNTTCVALDPLGGRAFLGSADGAIFSADLKAIDKPPNRLGFSHGFYPTQMACSSDRKTLFVLDNETLSMWDMVTWPEAPHWRVTGTNISCFAINPDSKLAYYSQTRGAHTHVIEQNVSNGQSRPLIEQSDRPSETLLLSANARYIAGLNGFGGIVLLKHSSEEDKWLPYALPFLCDNTSALIAFAPQASILITTADTSHRLIAWDLDREEILQEFDVHEGKFLGCCFLTENRFLTWSCEGNKFVWDLRSKTPVRELRQ